MGIARFDRSVPARTRRGPRNENVGVEEHVRLENVRFDVAASVRRGGD